MLYLLEMVFFSSADAVLWLLFNLWGILRHLVESIVFCILYLFVGRQPKNQPLLVVIGGGFAGALITKKLENRFSVTLVDNKDYFEFTPSVPHVLVDSAHVKRMHILHRDYLNTRKTVVINSHVTRIDSVKRMVEVAGRSGPGLPYDYLVVCTGSSYQLPFKARPGNVLLMATRATHITEYTTQLKKASSILVVGGGVVGVEVAGELVYRYPGKKIILVHSGQTLMNRTSDVTAKCRQYCEQYLRSAGVEVLLNRRLEDNDTLLYADVTIACTGISPNAAFLDKKFKNPQGFVQVTPSLRIVGMENCYAAGDVIASEEEKLAQAAEAHARIVVHNLRVAENIISASERTCQISGVAIPHRPMIVSLGPQRGSFIFLGWTINGLFPALMKTVVEWKVMTSYTWRRSLL